MQCHHCIITPTKELRWEWVIHASMKISIGFRSFWRFDKWIMFWLWFSISEHLQWNFKSIIINIKLWKWIQLYRHIKVDEMKFWHIFECNIYIGNCSVLTNKYFWQNINCSQIVWKCVFSLKNFMKTPLYFRWKVITYIWTNIYCIIAFDMN